MSRDTSLSVRLYVRPADAANREPQEDWSQSSMDTHSILYEILVPGS